MTKLNQIYKCPTCGNIVEVLHTGGGTLVCCGEPMELVEENTVDAAIEKHVPVIEKMEDGFRVKVGAVPHPMEEEHYIEWAELFFEDGRSSRKYLKPGDKPEVEFKCKKEPTKALIYCNLHGLWTDKK